MTEFRMLGPLDVVVDGVRIGLGGRNQRAVLAVLLLGANEAVSTTAIAEALWGEDVPGSAAGVVRTYVWRLRQVLAPASDVVLTHRSPGYVLEIDPDRIDAHHFEKLAGDARRHLDAGQADEALTILDKAVGLWRGDVLADLGGLDPLRPALVRLEQMRLTTVEDRIRARLVLGQHVEVVGDLTALTREHPYRERLWHQLILALYRSGRQAEALAAYQEVRAILVDQVGLEPGPELQALERGVLDHSDALWWRPPEGADPVTVVRPVDRRTAQPAVAELVPERLLVGRVGEQARLAALLGDARAGRFRAVFVAGPPGIGKTALVARVVRDARAAGMQILLGRTDEDHGGPFQPLSEVIGQWVACASNDERDKLGPGDLDQLGRIVPSLTGPSIASPAHSFGEGQGRLLLFEAIARWVAVVASGRPTVIVLEDLQWADPASLLAVRHLVRHPPAASALVLATHRDTGLDQSQQLAELLAGTRREPHVEHLHLAGLADREVSELLDDRAGGELDEAGHRFAAQLNSMTGGNPLFIVETLRHLTEQGTIEPRTGRWVHAPLESFGVPPAVTELLAERLARLPDATAALLAAASEIGEHFGLPVLSRMVSMAPIAVLEALEPAIAARLITTTGTLGSRFAFSHSLVRHAILDGLPPSRRTRLHWQAGEAIAGVAGTDPGAYRSEIAHHLLAGVHAGDPHLAIEANVQAGQHAFGACAFEEAYARYTTACDLLEATANRSELLAYEAWMGLGAASRGSERSERTRGSFLRAALIAREQQWPDRLARAVVGFTAHGVAMSPRDLDEPLAATIVEDALAMLSEVPPTVEHVMLLAVMTARAVVNDHFDQAREFASRAGDAAAGIADPAAQAAAAMARCWILLGTARPEELAEATEAATVPVDDRGYQLLLRYSVVAVLPVPALQQADRQRFEAMRYRLVATQPETRGTEHAAVSVALWDAAAALADGRFGELGRLHAVTPDIEPRPLWRASTQIQALLASVERGPLPGLVPFLTSLVSVMPEALVPRALLALVHAQIGDDAGATRETRALRRLRPFDQLGWGGPLALRGLAEVAARSGDGELAAELLPVLTGYAGQLLVSYSGITIDGAGDRAIGQLLLALGRLDEAIERLAAAAVLERSFGADALVARTTYWHARALFRRGGRGDQNAGCVLAAQATGEAHRLGMRPLAGDIDALGR